MVTSNDADAQRRTESACIDARRRVCVNHVFRPELPPYQILRLPNQNEQPILFASLEDDVMVALAFDSLNSALETERSKNALHR